MSHKPMGLHACYRANFTLIYDYNSLDGRREFTMLQPSFEPGILKVRSEELELEPTGT
jgi:hypothetical protein